MTVYSINKRAIDQAATMTPAANAPKSTADAAAEFASALQRAGSLFTAPNQPSAETALKAHFDRPVDQNRSAKTEAKPARTEGKSVVRERHDDDKAVRRSDKAEVKETRRDQKAAKVEDTSGNAEAVTEDVADDAPVTVADDGQQQNTQSQQQDTQPQLAAAPVQVVEQQAEAVVESDDDQVATIDDAPQAEVPAEALAANNADDAQQAQLGGEQVEDAGDDADDALAADAAQSLRDGAHKSVETASDDAQTDTVQAQATDLAQRLDGTGAKVKMEVKVADAAQDTQTDALAATDIQTQQAVAAPQQSANGQDAGTDADAAQQQPGVAQAAQAAAAARDADAAELAGQAKPFDAALAAQLEANSQPNTAPQQAPQPLAGIGGITAAAATQKASAPQAAQAPRQPQAPVDPQQVMDQVKVQIAKAGKNGNDTIKVQLKPVELGAIEIKVEVGKDGSVSATVTADNKQTLDALQKDSSSLHKALEDAGLKPDANSLSFNLRENQQQTQQNAQTAPRRRSRLSVAAAADAASAQAASAAQARWTASRRGVDIEV